MFSVKGILICFFKAARSAVFELMQSNKGAMNVILFVITVITTRNKVTLFVMSHDNPTINPVAQQRIREVC